MTENRVLGDRHRVAITSWPITDDPCGRFDTAAELFDHAKSSGYDGLEVSVDDMKKAYFKNVPYEEVIADVRANAERTGVQIIGALYFISDGDWRREQAEGAEGRDGGPADGRDRRIDGMRYMVNGPIGNANNPAVGRWDLDFSDYDFDSALRHKLALDKAMGSEYITFQIGLPPE